MKFGVQNLLLLAATHIFLSRTATAGTELTLKQRLEDIAKYKRSIANRRELTLDTNAVYTRSYKQVADALYNSLYKPIIQGQSVDIVLLLDGSSTMQRSGFFLARKTLARLISLMPAHKFRNGAIKVAMLTYSLSRNMTQVISFAYRHGRYREMVRRSVKRAVYQGGRENHGTSALWWVQSEFMKSPRYNYTNTTKVVLYATNGHITDDNLFGRFSDSTRYTTNFLKNDGYKFFTVVPGTSVDADRATINVLASDPKSDYILPVANSRALQSISHEIKEHIRGAHNHHRSRS